MNAKPVQARIAEYKHDKEYDRTALMWAVRWQDIEAVTLLLNQMTKAEQRVELNKQDRLGRTPLHLACSSSPDFGVLSLLLEAGANPNIEDNLIGTPLVKAIQTANPELVQFLLQHGVKVEGETGQEALETAEAYGLVAIGEILKEAKAGT